MSRNEQALQAIIDGDDSSKLEPAQSRNERILHAIIDDEDLSKLPAPQSPIESLLIQVGEKIQQGGGGLSAEPLSVTENGEYTAPGGKAYTPVNVSVPNTYSAADEGKVVQNGALAAQTPYSVASNGTYDTTTHDEVTVNVTPSLSALSVTANGTYTPSGFDGYSQVTVDVQGGGGGDHDVEDAIIQRAISGVYTNSRVTSLGSFAFCNCISLTGVNLPECSTIGSYAFSACYSLTDVSLPKCEYMVKENIFYSCTKLSTISLPKCKSIGSNTFAKCRNLLSVYLLNTMPSLYNSNAFSSTPIAGYTTSTGGVYGSIYVPASRVSSYQSATNWTYFSSRFVGLTSEQIAALEG